MKKLSRNFLVCLFAIMLAAPLARSSDSLQDVVQRMDRAAGDFQGMTAQVTYVTHTDVLNENTTETATVVMKKVQSGEVQGRVDFTSPDVKSVTFEKRRVQVFYPKINTLQIYELDKQGEQIDKFLMIGFGTSGSELAKDYAMKVLGTEALKEEQNVPTVRVQLIPKASEAKQYVSMLELWIPEQGGPYPVREKISQPSGDYRLVTYSGLKINPPNLKPDALRLKTPAGVKIEHPGK
jgi:hypothetical protein